MANTIVCPKCNGTKGKWETDIMKAKNHYIRCPLCSGTGEVAKEVEDGIGFAEWKRCTCGGFFANRKGKRVAWMEVRIYPLVKRGMKTQDFELQIVIVNMYTKKEYRRQGIMSEILRRACESKRVVQMVTGYEDTKENKAVRFLEKRGFHRDRDSLVWHRKSTGEGPGKTDGDKCEAPAEADRLVHSGSPGAVSNEHIIPEGG